MRPILYVVIPAAAFLLILANALFGHLLFSDPDHVTTKYSIYVRLQPEWDSYPANVIFDVTTSWSGSGGDLEETTYNENNLRYVGGRQVVELWHGYGGCSNEWEPALYLRAVDTVRHWLEYLQGTQLSTDPATPVYRDVEGIPRSKAGADYTQFIPLCSTSANTTYGYSFRSTGSMVGLDAYFVPSEEERAGFYTSEFEHYLQPGCSVQNKRSFGGTCGGVADGSGLLVVVPDELSRGVTKVTINLYEKDDG